jgi:hypothetical protein
LAYSLHDSPVGLLAWILEKLHGQSCTVFPLQPLLTFSEDWTDDYKWTDEEILRWISIYAFSTAGPGAAHRIYYEAKHHSLDGVPKERVMEWIDEVPLGLGELPLHL